MSNPSPSEHLARIAPVEHPNAGTVLSLAWKLALNAALVTIPAATILIQLFLFWLGFRLSSATSLAVVFCGLLTVSAINAGWIGTYPEWPMNRWLEARLRRACRKRHENQTKMGWIENARMVEWVPRPNWSATKLETAVDVMLIRVRDDGVEMEGDSGRYFLPCGSIIDTLLESRRPSGCFHRLHYVILTVRTEAGPMELPLAYRDHRLGQLRSAHRQHAAAELCNSIARIATGGDFTYTDSDKRSPAIDSGHDQVRAPSWDTPNPYASPRTV